MQMDMSSACMLANTDKLAEAHSGRPFWSCTKGLLFPTTGYVRLVDVQVNPELTEETISRLASDSMLQDHFCTVHSQYLQGSQMDILCRDPGSWKYGELRRAVCREEDRFDDEYDVYIGKNHLVGLDAPLGGWALLKDGCWIWGKGGVMFEASFLRNAGDASLSPNPFLAGIKGPLLVTAFTATTVFGSEYHSQLDMPSTSVPWNPEGVPWHAEMKREVKSGVLSRYEDAGIADQS